MEKELSCQIFKSIVEQDRQPIVVCDPGHTILYLNPAAKARYKRDLVGSSILDCHNSTSCARIQEVVEWFQKSPDNNVIFTYHYDKENKDIYMVALRDESGHLIGYYEKHECKDPETAPGYDLK